MVTNNDVCQGVGTTRINVLERVTTKGGRETLLKSLEMSQRKYPDYKSLVFGGNQSH